MSRKHKEKRPSNRVPREEVMRAVTEKAREGRLTCAAAHSIAEGMKVVPEEVGHAADVLGVKVAQCQLGLFGYGPGKKKIDPASEVPSGLKQAIELSMVNGRLACADAWKIADELHVSRMAVSSACEAMRIKISSCQLGAF